MSKRKVSRRNFLQASAGGATIAGLAGLTGGLGCGKPADSGGIKAGAAQRDITPPVGFEITHYYRVSIGIHDPLFARCLYLEDDQGNSVAMICTDLITASFDACDQMRAEIRKKTGIENSLIACSHSHSSAPLGPLLPHTRPSKPEGYPTSARDMIPNGAAAQTMPFWRSSRRPSRTPSRSRSAPGEPPPRSASTAGSSTRKPATSSWGQPHGPGRALGQRTGGRQQEVRQADGRALRARCPSGHRPPYE